MRHPSWRAVLALLLIAATAPAQVPPPSGYNLVQEEGAPLTRRKTLNLVGATVTCADDIAGARTTCTITGGTFADTSLSNLSSVSVNSDLIAQAGIKLGSAAAPWSEGYFGTAANNLRLFVTASKPTIYGNAGGKMVQFAPGIEFGFGGFSVVQNHWMWFGDGGTNTNAIRDATSQTPDAFGFYVGPLSRIVSISEYADQAFDFAVPQQLNPTLVVASSTQSTNERIGIRHNQVQGEIADLANTTANTRPIRVIGGAAVASAATITPTGNLFHVSGTATIDTITIMGSGTLITMVFDSTATVSDGVGNVKLPTAFVATADDTLTLASDGATWFYVSSGVN